jgi:hypothetical protein
LSCFALHNFLIIENKKQNEENQEFNDGQIAFERVLNDEDIKIEIIND